MVWPPTLDELKLDMKLDESDALLDERLRQVLDAAVSYVQRGRPEFRYDTGDPDQFELPDPTADLRLGALRLAGRWHNRRRSPDGMIAMGELGSARVSTSDGDIDRLLGLGRYQGPVFA